MAQSLSKAESKPVDKAKMEKEVIKGIVQLSRHKEFYGHIVQQLQKIYVADDHCVKTAAVGRAKGERFIKMYLALPFVAELLNNNAGEKGRNYLLGILEHEILHCILGHLFLKFQDKTRANVAMDCVCNCYIQKESLPGNYIHPDTYKLPVDKSAMWYYSHLADNEEYKKQCASGQLGAGGVLSHIMGSHKMWDDLKDDMIAEEFAKDIVKKAKDLCNKNYGNIPSKLIKEMENFLKRAKPIVPWGKVLRTFVASCAESSLDYTVKRISKRFGTRPGTRKEDILDLAVAVDTSGSVSDGLLQVFFNEIRWIWKNGAKITVYEADADIAAKYPFKGKFTGKVHGRGGTNLEPVLKEVEGKYDALVYFTDFYAPKIDTKYRIPILWVLSTDLEKANYPYSWGKHIKITDGKAEAG